MRALRTAGVAVAIGVAAIAPAHVQPANQADAASPWVDVPAVTPDGARIVASRVRLVAGAARTPRGSYLAGVDIVMAEGWKTYWRTPGDAGVPPTFDWSASTNAAAINVFYPAPMRMPEAGGQVIGYKQAVLFPTDVMPRDTAQPVVLRLALEYGVCRDICIPATATLELSLPPGRGDHSAPIQAALQRVPRPQQSRRKTDPELRSVAVNGEGPAARLTVEAVFHGKGADAFIEAPEGLYVPLPRRAAEEPGGVVRYEASLSPDLVRGLAGKMLTLTLVSEAGSTEAQWQLR